MEWQVWTQTQCKWNRIYAVASSNGSVRYALSHSLFNSVTQCGLTALSLATQSGQHEVVQLLVDQGGNANGTTDVSSLWMKERVIWSSSRICSMCVHVHYSTWLCNYFSVAFLILMVHISVVYSHAKAVTSRHNGYVIGFVWGDMKFSVGFRVWTDSETTCTYVLWFKMSRLMMLMCGY